MSRAVAICVPARNEADYLPSLVRSLAGQTGPATHKLRLVVVANNCTDDTVRVLKALQQMHRESALAIETVEVQFPEAEAHVGTARRLAMDRGTAWLEQESAPDGVLLTTDADAVAGEDWVAANLAALDHADLVGGRLVIGDDDLGGNPALEMLHRQIERYWAGVRALEQMLDPPACDPDPRHGDHTAASIALPVQLYREVGGMPALACGEDNELVARVRRLGGRVRHCPRVSITVSPRRVGRVTGGMASEMSRRAAILNEGARYELPPADHWQALFERRAMLRAAWNERTAADDGRFPRVPGLSHDDLAAIGPSTCKNGIAFVERAMSLESQHLAPPTPLAIEAAIAGIERRLGRLEKARGRS